MTISTIVLDRKTFASLGIGFAELPLEPPLEMRSLGNIVLLAGPNGAGKSRLLRMIPKLVQNHLNKEARQRLLFEIKSYEENIATWEARTRELTNGLTVSSVSEISELTKAEGLLLDNRTKRNELQSKLEITEFVNLRDEGPPPVVNFVPETHQLENPAVHPDKDVTERSGRMRDLGSQSSEKNAPAYLRETMRAAALARLGRLEVGSAAAAQQAEQDLLDLLKSLLSAEVTVGLNNSFNISIGKVELDTSGLSQGQQILFQFACLLHAQGAKLHNCIVLMDEPENHLHPKIVVEVVDRIRTQIGDGGQLWISTHSVPLIAHLAAISPDCLWLVEQGQVRSARRSPEKILHSLMGGASGAQNLHDFTMLPDQYASLRFMAQCLEPPQVVGPDIHDPQTNEIASILRDHHQRSGARLRVLDFGAGKARLLATLVAGATPPKDWLDYFAYDIDSDNQSDRQSELEAAYPNDAPSRLLNSKSELTSRLDGGSVDVVIMCNVLHEIDPDSWSDLFGATGYLTKLLGPKGVLLVVEDYGIPVGERAHRYGFLLLDEPELTKLFQITEADRTAKLFLRRSSQEPRYINRLVAHLVGKSCLERFNSASTKQAIETLHERMSGTLESLLRDPIPSSTSEAGRSYARTAQLLSNAVIWLKNHAAESS